MVQPMHEAARPPFSHPFPVFPAKTGTPVSKENKSVLLHLPAMHKLSISHDLPNLPVPHPVTGQADLQGTSDFSLLPPNHLGLISVFGRCH